jgi:uncharacterized protein (DUF1501 family)
MDRRSFISGMLAFGAGTLIGVGGGRPREARAALPKNDKRVLLSLTLDGGPDFRHLFAPAYSAQTSSYGYAYWSGRYRAHGLEDKTADWQQCWTDKYQTVSLGGVSFGVLKTAGWLIDQIKAGNVALVNNVIGASSRDHHHAVLVYESGDRATTPTDATRDGWGGRLAQTISGNVASMASRVRLFCNGRHASDPHKHDNASVITVANSRSIEKIRAIGGQIDTRLGGVPIPAAIKALYEGNAKLKNVGFGSQIRNVYDCFACSDIFGFRVGSMSYGGWDSHRDQAGIEGKLEDIFGRKKGFDALFSSLQKTMPSAHKNSVVVVGGEFGRQLKDNGDKGTDHGKGNTVLVIGPGVRGGVYGELFPQAEIPRYKQANKDIDGKDGIERVFAEACDFVESGAGDKVFANRASSPLESGVQLGKLFG